MSWHIRAAGFARPNVGRIVVFVGALFIVAFTALSSPAAAATSAWTSTGPFGGQVGKIAINPKTPGTLFAISQVGGVFRSTDSGGHWVRVTTGITDPFATFDVAIDPTNPNNVYVGDPLGLYKSTNDGASWKQHPQGAGLYSLVVDPHASNTLYGTNGSAVETSTNGGLTWRSIGSGLPSGGQIVAITIDPVKSATLYAATTMGVYKTENSGALWKSSGGGMASGVQIFNIRIDPANDNHLYAAGRLNSSAAVYESTNGGAHWSSFPTKGLTAGIADLRIDPKTPRLLYIALGLGYGQNGVYVNKNRAASWTAIDTGLDAPVNSINQLAINPKTPTRLYAATNYGVFTTGNSGSSWHAANKGLANTRATVLAVDADSKTIYAGTVANGLFKSTNRGVSWTAIDKGLPTSGSGLPIPMSIAIDPGNSRHLFAGFEFADPGNLWQSVNGGSSWTPIAALNYQGTVFSIAFDPTNAKNVFAGANAGLYRSTDGGATWKLISAKPTTAGGAGVQPAAGLPAGKVTQIASESLDGQLFLEALISDSDGNQKAYFSDDNGKTWRKLNDDPDFQFVKGFFWGRELAKRLPAAYGKDTADAIYAMAMLLAPVQKSSAKFSALTTDGASLSAVNPAIATNKWTPWKAPKGIDPTLCAPVTSFAQDPKSPSTLFAGGNYGCGVLRGASLGQNVTPMNAGLPYQSLAVNALAATANGCDVFAGTEGGSVYRFTFTRSGCKSP